MAGVTLCIRKQRSVFVFLGDFFGGPEWSRRSPRWRAHNAPMTPTRFARDRFELSSMLEDRVAVAERDDGVTIVLREGAVIDASFVLILNGLLGEDE